jgi:hypothetical protein
VYASFDGFMIWLRTGEAGWHEMALEPEVLTALIDCAASLKRIKQPER